MEELTDQELVTRLRKRGLFQNDGKITEPIYQLGVDILPIICADVIPVRKVGNNFQIGIIIRATGPEAGKAAIIGGRIKRNQKAVDAISEHLSKDLKIVEWKFFPGNNEHRPFYVQQYFQKDAANDNYGYDPTKHAVALTYVIEITGVPNPANEAVKFMWISPKEIPTITAYNHQEVMKQACEFIEKQLV